MGFVGSCSAREGTVIFEDGAVIETDTPGRAGGLNLEFHISEAVGRELTDLPRTSWEPLGRSLAVATDPQGEPSQDALEAPGSDEAARPTGRMPGGAGTEFGAKRGPACGVPTGRGRAVETANRGEAAA